MINTWPVLMPLMLAGVIVQGEHGPTLCDNVVFTVEAPRPVDVTVIVVIALCGLLSAVMVTGIPWVLSKR